MEIKIALDSGIFEKVFVNDDRDRFISESMAYIKSIYNLD